MVEKDVRCVGRVEAVKNEEIKIVFVTLQSFLTCAAPEVYFSTHNCR